MNEKIFREGDLHEALEIIRSNCAGYCVDREIALKDSERYGFFIDEKEKTGTTWITRFYDEIFDNYPGPDNRIAKMDLEIVSMIQLGLEQFIVYNDDAADELVDYFRKNPGKASEVAAHCGIPSTIEGSAFINYLLENASESKIKSLDPEIVTMIYNAIDYDAEGFEYYDEYGNEGDI